MIRDWGETRFAELKLPKQFQDLYDTLVNERVTFPTGGIKFLNGYIEEPKKIDAAPKPIAPLDEPYIFEPTSPPPPPAKPAEFDTKDLKLALETVQRARDDLIYCIFNYPHSSTEVQHAYQDYDKAIPVLSSSLPKPTDTLPTSTKFTSIMKRARNELLFGETFHRHWGSVEKNKVSNHVFKGTVTANLLDILGIQCPYALTPEDITAGLPEDILPELEDPADPQYPADPAHINHSFNHPSEEDPSQLSEDHGIAEIVHKQRQQREEDLKAALSLLKHKREEISPVIETEEDSLDQNTHKYFDNAQVSLSRVEDRMRAIREEMEARRIEADRVMREWKGEINALNRMTEMDKEKVRRDIESVARQDMIARLHVLDSDIRHQYSLLQDVHDRNNRLIMEIGESDKQCQLLMECRYQENEYMYRLEDNHHSAKLELDELKSSLLHHKTQLEQIISSTPVVEEDSNIEFMQRVDHLMGVKIGEMEREREKWDRVRGEYALNRLSIE